MEQKLLRVGFALTRGIGVLLLYLGFLLEGLHCFVWGTGALLLGLAALGLKREGDSDGLDI